MNQLTHGSALKLGEVIVQDPFASSGLSIVLAWVVAIPVILGAIGSSANMLFSRVDSRVPRWFVFWLMLCVLVLSPIRYMVLQTIIGSAFMVQSVHAVISTVPMMFYVPIVFGLLYFVGVGLPLLATLVVAFGSVKEPVATWPRLILGTLLAPITAAGGYYLFFLILPAAGWTVHWVDPRDLIGATNGPAAAVYRYLEPVTPLQMKGYYNDVTVGSGDALRNHVASIYLGRKPEARYVHDAYPALYAKLTSEEPR